MNRNLFLVFFCMSVLMITEMALAEPFWELGPDKVRKMLNEKFLAIKAEKPEVLKVENITIKTDDRTTPLRIYTPR